MLNKQEEFWILKHHEEFVQRNLNDVSIDACQAIRESNLTPADEKKKLKEMTEKIDRVFENLKEYHRSILLRIYRVDDMIHWRLGNIKQDVLSHKNFDFMLLRNFAQSIWNADEDNGDQFAHVFN